MIDTISFIAAISMAAERIVEIIKGIIHLKNWKISDNWKIVLIQFFAVIVGTGITFAIGKDAILPLYLKSSWGYVIVGLLSGAGSSVWNSTLKAVDNLKTKK